ncbi:MAG TPA: sigma-70 family RNA polymerase sigma factor [Rubrivivax sp.]|nr:sigma-70 family RNA polymerase sigma factor [Rubrivivax sp.]HPO18600.1 sigma-70 family RNA polymerase sigma factor [Rubrivivax sp.]
MSHTRDADDVADDFELRLRPLWLRAQAGDEAAYRTALQRMAVRLRAYLRRRMQAWPDEVEDLVQETLLALHLQRGTWDASLPVSAWMLAIARHKLVDLWRRHGRRAQELASLDVLDEHDAPAAGDHEQHLARRDLGVLLGSISSAQREAIVLTKIEGLSLAEVSARTGASVAAVKVQVHRGLKKLAELAWKTT